MRPSERAGAGKGRTASQAWEARLDALSSCNSCKAGATVLGKGGVRSGTRQPRYLEAKTVDSAGPNASAPPLGLFPLSYPGTAAKDATETTRASRHLPTPVVFTSRGPVL